jgi:hypothetical protein
MLDLLLVALVQAAAGEPAQTPPSTPAQTESQAPVADTAEETRERRRCRSRQVTGTRLQTLVTCRTRGNGLQDLDTRETLHDVQRPPPIEVH